MQPKAVYGSDLSLSKVTYQQIFVSADLDPDLDIVQVIAWLLSEYSNINPHISRLRTNTRFITTLSCDLKHDITNPTSRNIFNQLICILICQLVLIMDR